MGIDYGWEVVLTGNNTGIIFLSMGHNRASKSGHGQWAFLLATLFPGLLDTPNGNEICTDAARNYCVVAEHFEMLFSIVQNVSVAARVFKPAIMQR